MSRRDRNKELKRRKRRQTRAKQRETRRQSENQARNETLEAFGVRHLFDTLPSRDRDWIARALFGSMAVRLEGEASATDTAVRTKEEIGLRLRWITTSFTLRERELQWGVAEYLRFVAALHSALYRMRADDSLASGFPVDEILTEEGFLDEAGPAFDLLDHQVMTAIIMNRRIHTCRLWGEIKPSRDRYIEIVLHAEPTRSHRIQKPDGDSVLAYQPDHGILDPLEPITWPEMLPIGGSGGRKLPVYLESHAIHQLHARLSMFAEYVVHDVMSHCLHQPDIRRSSQGDMLVRYVWHTDSNTTLGYFPVIVKEEFFQIPTFLPVTMQGTPEGDHLSERLRASREDYVAHDLDKLETYLSTDLLKDPRIRSILDECGLSHLARLREWTFDSIPATKGSAAAVRKWFRLE